MNFLILKASAIRNAQSAGHSAIIDRSIYEDRDVMARSWAERYWDEPARRTYESCANMLIERLPVPDAIIYCNCPPNVCETRRQARNRQVVPSYDDIWTQRLEELYNDFARDFSLCPVLQLDTGINDVRDRLVVENIISDLESYFAPPPTPQTMLFDLSGRPPGAPLFEPPHTAPAMRVLRPLNDTRPARAGALARSAATDILGRELEHPVAYLAAPFTNVAVAPDPVLEELRLPVDSRSHGVLPRDYRRSLERIADALEGSGFSTVIPHRDVNDWGRKQLSSTEVANACIRLVSECDMLLGILGDSYGAHVEAGVALALGKPCLFFQVETFTSTFVGAGLAHAPGARRIQVEQLDDVVPHLTQRLMADIQVDIARP